MLSFSFKMHDGIGEPVYSWIFETVDFVKRAAAWKKRSADDSIQPALSLVAYPTYNHVPLLLYP